MFPFNLSGPAFLVVYVVSMLSACLAATLYRTAKADNGRGCETHPLHTELDPYEIGYLRAGQKGVIDAAVASLVQSKVLVPTEKAVEVHSDAPHENHPVIAEVVRNLQVNGVTEPKKIRELSELWKNSPLQTLNEIQAKLIANGFVLSNERASAIAMASGGIAALPLALGFPKLVIGISHDKPVAFLIVLLIITAVFAIVYCCCQPTRTSRGQAAFDHLSSRETALNTTAKSNSDGLTPQQVATAAALFGPAIFAQGMLGDFYKRIAPPSSGGSGCGSGSSCGSGGCGGGGCGGCGG